MILRLDHVAIAVPDLERAIARLTEDLGIPCTGREDVAREQTSTAFHPIAGTRIELLHPMDHAGPVQRFLEKRGPGIHHLCFLTDNIDEDVARLRAKGYSFVTEEPHAGAHGHRVIFIHPRSFDGVLVELSQAPS